MKRLDETENLLLQLLAEMAQGRTLDRVVQGSALRFGEGCANSG